MKNDRQNFYKTLILIVKPHYLFNHRDNNHVIAVFVINNCFFNKCNSGCKSEIVKKCEYKNKKSK